MSQPPESTISTQPLRVHTRDLQSEILILDSKGRLLTRGFGPDCTFQLERGIYRVKVLTGTASEEKPVLLNGEVTVDFAPINFASAVPLAGTSTSHEYHMFAADHESRTVHVQDGIGSSLFFLIRNWSPSGSQSKKVVTNNPAEGLSLHSVSPSGERKICDLVTAGTTNPMGDPWTACTVAVTPGVYELQLALPAGDTLRQPVVASPGWQTQSFLFVRQCFGTDGPVWRADLARTSVLLTGVHGGFNPNEALLRVAELARQRLAITTVEPGEASTRSLLPEEMRKLLRGKLDNPMLGIYAAHLMLLEPSLDMALFRDMVGTLRSMLPQHPDVEALALRADLGPVPGTFSDPPMLSRSWFLITDASVDRADLVSDWLAQRSVGNALTQGPWLVLRAEQVAAPYAAGLQSWATAPIEQVAASSGASQETNGVGDRGEDLVADGASAYEPPMVQRTSQPAHLPETLDLTELESAVAESLGIAKKIRWSELRTTHPSGLAASQPAPDLIEEDLDLSRLRSVATRFGIPAPQVKGVLSGLEKKLNSNPSLPNLNVRYK